MTKNLARIALLLAVAAPVAAQPTQPGSAPVATLNGKAITAAEIETFLGSKLLKTRQQEYEIKSEGIREYAFRLLQDAEAAKLGITRDALYKRNVADKAGEPTEDEITTVLTRFRSRLPGDDAQARQEVVKFLREQRRLEREAAYRQELFDKAALKVLLDPPRAALPIEADDPVIGKADAAVTVVEFSDFQCPFCKNANVILRQLRTDYGDRVRLAFKQLPLGMHAQARGAAEAALCANDQGKYWELREWMFNNPNLLKPAALVEQAGALGIKVEPFRKCVDGNLKAAAVDRDIALAEELGATGTPTFFVNGRLMEGARSVEDFKRVIDEELARPAAPKPAATR
ncbi:MAG: DsbA family protein [Acidobacteria bacterium]|nr:DsbA family protein [Acidobacteriota bacterium]